MKWLYDTLMSREIFKDEFTYKHFDMLIEEMEAVMLAGQNEEIHDQLVDLVKEMLGNENK